MQGMGEAGDLQISSIISPASPDSWLTEGKGKDVRGFMVPKAGIEPARDDKLSSNIRILHIVIFPW